jgi:hypothetical protein
MKRGSQDCRQHVAADYFLTKILFTGENWPQVNVVVMSCRVVERYLWTWRNPLNPEHGGRKGQIVYALFQITYTDGIDNGMKESITILGCIYSQTAVGVRD